MPRKSDTYEKPRKNSRRYRRGEESDSNDDNQQNEKNYKNPKSSTESERKGRETKFYNRDSDSNSRESSESVVSKDRIYKGLNNIGNTCFFNSVIQNISNLTFLYDMYSSLEKSFFDKNSVTIAFYYFLRQMHTPSFSSFSPRELLSSISHQNPRFKGYRQQDANELFLTLIDLLDEEEKKALGIKRSESMMSREVKTRIETSFASVQQSAVICQKCMHVSITESPVFGLTLTLPSHARYMQEERNAMKQREQNREERSKRFKGFNPFKSFGKSQKEENNDTSNSTETTTETIETSTTKKSESSLSEYERQKIHNRVVNYVKNMNKIYIEHKGNPTNGSLLKKLKDTLNYIRDYAIIDEEKKKKQYIVEIIEWKEGFEKGLEATNETSDNVNNNINNEIASESNEIINESNEIASESNEITNESNINNEINAITNDNNNTINTCIDNSHIEKSIETNLPVSMNSSVHRSISTSESSQNTSNSLSICNTEQSTYSSIQKDIEQHNKNMNENDTLQIESQHENINLSQNNSSPNINESSIQNNDSFTITENPLFNMNSSSIINTSSIDTNISSTNTVTTTSNEHDQTTTSNEHEQTTTSNEHEQTTSSNEHEQTTEIIDVNMMFYDSGGQLADRNLVHSHSITKKQIQKQIETKEEKEKVVIIPTVTIDLNLQKTESLQKLYKKYNYHTVDSHAVEQGTLFEALRAYYSTETLLVKDGCEYRCENCSSNKEPRDIYKRITNHTLPNILVIHFKRFYHSAFRGYVKNDEPVDFPEEFDMKPFCMTNMDKCYTYYRLSGVVTHAGGLGGGHYTCYIRDQQDETMKKWYYISDSYVSPCSINQVLNAEAYMLFYERISK